MTKKIKIGLASGILLVVVAAVSIAVSLYSRVDQRHLPKFVTANILNINDISAVSKFRSGAGHDFSGGDETCRSMKHYFALAGEFDLNHGTEEQLMSDSYPATIPVYAPTDGTISKVEAEHFPVGKQIFISPAGYPQFTIRLFHVYVDEGIGAGTAITAGQEIGKIKDIQQMDVAVQSGLLPWQKNYYSFFQFMTDPVLQEYTSRGASGVDDFIITKEYRDEHPLECNGEEFTTPQQGITSADWVILK